MRLSGGYPRNHHRLDVASCILLAGGCETPHTNVIPRSVKDVLRQVQAENPDKSQQEQDALVKRVILIQKLHVDYSNQMQIACSQLDYQVFPPLFHLFLILNRESSSYLPVK